MFNSRIVLRTAGLVLCVVGIATAAKVNGFLDVAKIAAPAAPLASFARLYVSSGTNQLVCTNPDASSCLPVASGGARILISGATAVCQSGVIAGVSGSTPAANAVTGACAADGLSGYISANNNAGTGYFFYQRVDLPPDWAGTLKLNISLWSASTNSATVKYATGCVVNGVTSGITFNTFTSLGLNPMAASGRTNIFGNAMTTTGCTADATLFVKYNIVGEAGNTPLNILSLQVTE